MTLDDIISLFGDAFEGVVLGHGVSLREAQVMDSRGRMESDATDPEADVTDNWAAVPRRELDRGCIAHLDAEGLRYYLPALAVELVRDYDPASMRVIGTLSALYPDKDVWSYHMDRYKLLSARQKHAVAIYLTHLPTLVSLDHEDATLVRRALRNYWAAYLVGGDLPVGD